MRRTQNWKKWKWSILVLLFFGGGAVFAKGPGSTVTSIAADPQHSQNALAICICDVVDNCLPLAETIVGKVAKSGPCATIPTPAECEAFMKPKIKARAKRAGRDLSDAEVTAAAKAGCARGLGQNNAGHLKDERPFIFFLPAVGDLNQWAKKGGVHNEITDLIIGMFDPAASPKMPAGLGGLDKRVANALRLVYIEMKGYIRTGDYVGANSAKVKEAFYDKAAAQKGHLDQIKKKYGLQGSAEFKKRITICMDKAAELGLCP